MQETIQPLTLATAILSETVGADTEPNKHTKEGRIRKGLKQNNNILISWSLNFSLESIF